MTTPQALKGHLKTAHGVEDAKDGEDGGAAVKCDLCNREFQGLRALTIHKHMTHQSSIADKPGHCNICQVQVAFINDHIAKHHSLTYGTTFGLQCMTCQYKFNTPQELQSHIRKNRCGWLQTDAQAAAVAAAQQQLIRPPTTEPKQYLNPAIKRDFACGHCGKEFKVWTDLEAHMKRRHPEVLTNGQWLGGAKKEEPGMATTVTSVAAVPVTTEAKPGPSLQLHLNNALGHAGLNMMKMGDPSQPGQYLY